MLVVDKEKLLGLLIERRLSLKEVGTLSGVAQATLSHILRSKGAIRVTTLARLSDALAVNYRELLKEDTEYA